MIKAIFFDFNGVIIDDEPIQMRAYKEVLREYDIDLTEEDYFSALGMDDRTFVRTMFERAKKQLTPAMVVTVQQGKTRLHRKMIEDELPLFPGVVTFLKAAARRYSLGLVSMANNEEVGYVFERAQIGQFFSVVVTAEDVEICKPAPACYLRGLEKLNAKRRSERLMPLLAAECLAVEDSPPGIRSGRAAGMRTLGVTNTVSGEELRTAGAEIVTGSLADWTTAALALLF